MRSFSEYFNFVNKVLNLLISEAAFFPTEDIFNSPFEPLSSISMYFSKSVSFRTCSFVTKSWAQRFQMWEIYLKCTSSEKSQGLPRMNLILTWKVCWKQYYLRLFSALYSLDVVLIHIFDCENHSTESDMKLWITDFSLSQFSVLLLNKWYRIKD